MIYESRLIQLFVHGSRLSQKIYSRGRENILISRITNK